MELLPLINNEYLQEILVDLLTTPSPTGYTHLAMAYVQGALESFPELNVSLTPKGALVAEWMAPSSGSARALTAHLDTLGAMVKEIRSNPMGV
jgi:putative aminopeptidase FrvX